VGEAPQDGLKVEDLKCGLLLRWSSDEGNDVSHWILLEERQANFPANRTFRMFCVYANKPFGICPGEQTNYEFNRFNIGNYSLLSHVP
jgi:hypothetical protein